MALLTPLMKIKGIIDSIFQIGTNQVKSTSDIVEVRNLADNAYAQLKLLDPPVTNVVAEDPYGVTIKHFFTRQNNLIIVGEKDCDVALPTNTATRQLWVVSTAGNGAVLGGLLYDDGSGSGNMIPIGTHNGRTVSILADCSTAGLAEHRVYMWETDTWYDIGSTASVGYAAERIVIGTDASYLSSNNITAGKHIDRIKVIVGTGYENVPSTTLELGSESDADLLLATTDCNIKVVGSYEYSCDIEWPSTEKVMVSILDTPSAGAGVVIVYYY